MSGRFRERAVYTTTLNHTGPFTHKLFLPIYFFFLPNTIRSQIPTTYPHHTSPTIHHPPYQPPTITNNMKNKRTIFFLRICKWRHKRCAKKIGKEKKKEYLKLTNYTNQNLQAHSDKAAITKANK